jgi:hypothetical protein
MTPRTRLLSVSDLQPCRQDPRLGHGTGQSSADVPGVPRGVIATVLTSHLIREIVTRGARGMPLLPLISPRSSEPLPSSAPATRLGYSAVSQETLAHAARAIVA